MNKLQAMKKEQDKLSEAVNKLTVEQGLETVEYAEYPTPFNLDNVFDSRNARLAQELVVAESTEQALNEYALSIVKRLNDSLVLTTDIYNKALANPLRWIGSEDDIISCNHALSSSYSNMLQAQSDSVDSRLVKAMDGEFKGQNIVNLLARVQDDIVRLKSLVK